MFDDESLIPMPCEETVVEQRRDAAMGELRLAVAALARVIELGLKCEAEEARRHLRVACELLNSTEWTAITPAKMAPTAHRTRIAPWRARLLKAHIQANLNIVIRREDLARLAGLSVSHFSRAFRLSFGCSPHAYVVRARVARARDLMSGTSAALGQIAVECGFADQPHFCRHFRKFMQVTPAAWRRANCPDRTRECNS